METETLTSYDQPKEQLSLGSDIKENVNHTETANNHVGNHNSENDSIQQDKGEIDDTRSDEEEEDVPLNLEGSKSDEHSDDELSHLDLHNNDDDDDEDMDSGQKNDLERKDGNDLDELQSQKDEDQRGNSGENGKGTGLENDEIEANLSDSNNTETLKDVDHQAVNEEKEVSSDIENASDVVPKDTETKENRNTEQENMETETLEKKETNVPIEKEKEKDVQNDEEKVEDVRNKLDKGNDVENEKKKEEDIQNEEEKSDDKNEKENDVQSEKEKESIGNEEVSVPDDNTKMDNKPVESEDIVDGEAIKDKVDSAEENDTSTSKSVDKEDVAKQNKVENKVESDSLLKQTLSRPIDNKEDEVDDDIDMDEDFDPSLLCPDIAMEVDEAHVITNSTEPPSRDGNKSPALYEPIFSTVVDEFTGAEASIHLTPDEEELRRQRYGDHNPVQGTKIHCTACNVHLGSALDGQGNRFVHPLLKVLICKNCYHFYTSGEFEKDEDGSELYCRWCGQGGQVMCCSNCEMVFCKKCIRINFDRKTIAQIRDSEDWVCFRCNPSQITHLKIHCAEFMEYVRRETSRASTLDNAVDFMKQDHCQCCAPQKKKATEPAGAEPPRKKKRKASVDPDFDPFTDRDSPQPSTSGVQTSNCITVAAKSLDPNKNAGVVKVNPVVNNNVKMPNSSFKPRATLYGPRPRVQVVGSSNAQATRPSTSPSPGYIKILPGGIRVPGNTPSPRIRTPQVRPIKPAGTPTKHEWFDRTVIAAARVNSNLSYTLTQLNRQQANAVSVEALAVVHNKLQEILSSSINTLISIRKKLRLEFIEGIKNIRFPPNKPAAPPVKPTTTTTSNTTDQDDDVIFISPSTSPIPPPIATTSSSSNSQPAVITITPVNSAPPPLTPIVKNTATTNSNSRSNSPVVSVSSGNDQPKSFLRVKSLNSLLNISSDSITITQKSSKPTESTVVEDEDDDDIKIIEKPVVQVDLTENETETEQDGEQTTYYDLNQPPTEKLKQMMNIKVVIKKSSKIEELIQDRYGTANADAVD